MKPSLCFALPSSRTAAVCLHFIAAAALAVMPLPGSAQAPADKSPVRLVVPFAAGTPTDSIARTIGQELAQSIGRPVIVDNRPGAAGGIGTEAVTMAAPDGQTLLLTVNSTVTINPLLYTKLKYDPMKDLAPVALVAVGGYLLVANPQTGYKDMAGLIRAAKARPGRINFASYGAGSMSHMCAEIFQSMADIKLFHVPYKSGSLSDIIGGQVELGFEPVGPAIANVQSAKLVALGATSSQRIDALATVPAIGELIKGYDCTAWVGVLAPARTPAPLRRSLSESIQKIAATPEFADKMRGIGLTAQVGNESQFGRLIQQDHDKWAAVVKPLNLKLD